MYCIILGLGKDNVKELVTDNVQTKFYGHFSFYMLSKTFLNR